MQIGVCLLPDSRRVTADVDLAVVIDVLRATSVMATALAAGAEQIVTCRTVEEARELASAFDHRPLLCGERHCRPIEGFDLGNSPAEYTRKRVAGRTLLLTTTNGTAAIASAGQARELVTSSFLNLQATVAALAPHRRIEIVCAGTEGRVTTEDVLSAGALVDRALDRYGGELLGDEARIARDLWRAGPDPAKLPLRLRDTQGGRNLIAAGYEQDLAVCSQIDSYDVCPRRVDREPVTFRPSDLHP